MIIHNPSLGSLEVPHKIGSAVLTFNGYKHPDRQAKNIYRKGRLFLSLPVRSNGWIPGFGVESGDI